MKIEMNKSRPENERYLDEADAYLDDAIAEYIYIRESVISAFLSGVIQMGAILHKHREELKKTGKWMEFCTKTDIHITQANQQIRMYELSLENTRIEIIKKTITNWTKLNMFMSLNDEEKEEMLDLIESGDVDEGISAIDMREVISDVKGTNIPEDNISDILGTRNPLHEDNKFAAENIRKLAGMEYSSKPFLEAYSAIQKGIDILKGQTGYPRKDAQDLKNLMETQIAELADTLGTLSING